MPAERSAKGRALNELIHEAMHFHGVLMDHGERIAAAHGQTPARWKVLGGVRDRPLTVSQVARRMGLTRQSVQRVADELIAAGLLRAEHNPDHARAPLLDLTPEGRAVLDRITRLQVKWTNRLAQGLDPESLAAALAGLRGVCTHLEERSFPDSFFTGPGG
jgi:DNA-binding MarR family transcriptional regulator